MQEDLLKQLTEHNKKRRRRRNWQRVVTGLAAVAMFCTTYALILPAITMEKGATCGIEAHTHDDSCYQTTQAQLACPLELHSHSDSCRDAEGKLICGYADFMVHSHDSSCYDAQENLACMLSEVKTHTHGDSCYCVPETEPVAEAATEPVHVHGDACYSKIQGDLICTEPEQQPHIHGDECYTTVTNQTCTIAESAGHQHGDGCRDENGNLICTQEESEGHSHGETCFETVQELTCQQSTEPGHQHTDDCYAWEKELTCQLSTEPAQTEPAATEASAEPELVCTKDEIILHTHSADCFDTNGNVTCGMMQVTEHVHSESCFAAGEAPKLICGKEEHTHDEVLCYIDTTADVETASDWEKTLPDELTGQWDLDLLEVAMSQLDYRESARNVQVDANGNIKGYTRYGAWYGYPYGDWCAMFVSFCLNYAEIGEEYFPYESGCARWVEALTEAELFASAADYTPVPGDVIFFDVNDDTYASHVGIVAELIPGTEETPDQIKTIEGNTSGDRVAYRTYDLTDEDILGYGMLPENPGPEPETTEATEETQEPTEATEPDYACGLTEHTHGDSCYAEDGEVLCVLPEHTHSESCTETGETESAYVCGLTEHTHDENCYDAQGGILCTLEEHTHSQMCTETETVDERVAAVIAMIDALPTAEEIEAKIMEFEEAEDYEGEEAWLTEIYQQVGDVYFDYSVLLPEELRPLVTNADKLMELEYIWSAAILIDDIVSDAPNPIASASTKDFIDLNLYDYNSKINTNYKSDSDWPGFQWNGGAYHKNGSTYNRHNIDFIDFGNSLITDFDYGSSASGSYGVSANRQNIGNQGGNINAIVEYPSGDYANKPVGMSNGTEVLSRTLSVAGYPWVLNAGSMVDYFTESTFADKMNTQSIDGLFRINQTSGAYYYNSRWNHAQYGNNKFTLYEDIITPNFITYPFGNFLPLNDITNSNTATQVSKISAGMLDTYVQQLINNLIEIDDNNTSAAQLWQMLAKYRANLQSISTSGGTAWSTWSAKDAIYDYILNGPTDDSGPITDALLKKMYNIDWDVDTNFFFGMEMKMNFMQPKGGITGKDNGSNSTGTWAVNSSGDYYLTGSPDGQPDYPMVFYFTGDDDVWVYIDGVLFLDLSGIHRHVGGEIDFVNGKVHYYALDTSTGDVSSTAYKTYTFAELLSAAGKSTDVLNSSGTFIDYSTHEFKFYYIERGSGSSVCRLNFNFPLLRQNSISVSKALDSDVEIQGNPDYRFQVLKANSDGTKTENLFIAANTQYTIYDANDNEIGTGTTDANGVFTLKAGQRAEFTGIDENAGKYYVRELLEGTVLEQYGKVTVSGESTTTSGNITIGSDTFTGMDSPVKDMSDGATAFRFTNDVDETHLGSLSVSKQLSEYSAARAVKYFDIEVKLDGELLSVGTEYTVGGETRTVQTAGIITIAAGEKATIANVLAGTKFTVKETSGSAEGYIVTYSAADGYTVEQADGGVSGEILVKADVQIVVNNSEKGTTVTIPGTKSLLNPDGREHTYTMRLTEVTDHTGTVETEGGVKDYTAAVTVGDADGTFEFRLNYVQVELSGLPKTFYYRITEDTPADALASSTVYVAEVTVSQNEGGDLTASVTRMWKNGTEITDGALSADFANTLTGSLSLSKTVSGGSTDTEFGFTIALEPGTSGLTQLPEQYKAILNHQDGSTETVTVTFTDGALKLTMKHGESLTITGIPYGAAWSITETDTKGYQASYRVDGADDADGTVTGGTVDMDGTMVAYTNTMLYELPETGGAGTQLYTMGGLLLMAAAAILLYIHTKRRKEDFASS